LPSPLKQVPVLLDQFIRRTGRSRGEWENRADGVRGHELVDEFQDWALPAAELRHPELRRARAFIQPPVALEPVWGAWLATMRRLDRTVGFGVVKDHHVDVERALFHDFRAVPRYRETHPDRQRAAVDDKVGQAGSVQGAAKHPDHTP